MQKLSILLYFISMSLFSQNERDNIIHDSIYPFIHNVKHYEAVKKQIRDLETKYGYETDLKYILLNQSFEAGDFAFFKAELTILVKDYGFNIAYEPKKKSYYKAITTGNLATWFKNMYLKNHFIWLENNFLKQIELRKLNTIRQDISAFNKLRYQVDQKLALDSTQKAIKNKIFEDVAFENLANLYTITRKLNLYPTGKNFALIQNNFAIIEYQNFSFERNFEKSWLLFEPYYNKAYKRNEIDYIIYKNYDNYSFLHYKNQRYGLISIFDIPEIYQNDLFSIPIRDLEFSKKIKTEFNWD